MAAPPAVGILTSAQSLTLDRSKVIGTATLLEGSRIETGTAPAQLQLTDGGRIEIGAESKGVVYRDRLVLERGSGRFENYVVEAFLLKIRPDGPGASAEIAVRNCSLAGPGTLRVAAFNGPVRITSPDGALVSNLPAGRTLDFVTGDPGSAAGCALAVAVSPSTR
jgi:hypothetical protein